MKEKINHLTPEEFKKMLEIMAEKARQAPKWMREYMKQIDIQPPLSSWTDNDWAHYF